MENLRVLSKEKGNLVFKEWRRDVSLCKEYDLIGRADLVGRRATEGRKELDLVGGLALGRNPDFLQQ